MSPSVTIRQQWGERFIEAYLPETENPDEYISYSLTNPKLITSITYQALHAAFTKSVMESEADEDEFEAEEFDKQFPPKEKLKLPTQLF